jgi:hypothetical protein
MSQQNPHPGRAGRHRLLILGLAALSLLCSVGFVLAPVQRPEAVYSWPATAGSATAVAIPLMVSTPAELRADVDCAAARAAGDGTVLVSTIPLADKPGAEDLQGLRVSVTDGDLRVRTGGTDLAAQPVPATGDCSWTLVSTASSTVLRLDDRVVTEHPGDLRPVVAGVFSESPTATGLSVEVTADTIFQTSPSVLKTALAVPAVLALLAALVLVARQERQRRTAGTPADEPADPAGSSASRRPGAPRWLVDAGVVITLAAWNVIGPLTVDDGYISGIIRSRGSNGYVGNVYRWFNAPEAPFGWIYEVMDAWSHVSDSTTWMRIPSTLLGIATWFLVGRGLLPRLGAFAARLSAYAAAGLVFLVWWLPTNLGLRPESWVAVGFAAVLVLVERGLARQRLLPVLVAFVLAGATLAVTPTGAVAFLPFLAAAAPILRLARRSDGPGLTALFAVAVASAATALLIVFADQSLAGVLRANDYRSVLPGAVPWSSEAERWYQLLTAGELQGSIVRRVPVLLTVVAAGAVVWRRLSGRWTADLAGDVADRLVATFGLSLLLLLFTPTKWTMHFGAFVPVGTALIVLGLQLFDRRAVWAGALPTRSRLLHRVPAGRVTSATVGGAVVLLVAAWSYAGWNQYAFLSNDYVPWHDVPPLLAGHTWSTGFLALALLVALAGSAAVVWARSRGADDVAVPAVRWLPSPALVAVLLVTLTVALQIGSMARAAWSGRSGYTLAGDVTETLDPHACGLAEDLVVEQDPAAGLLQPSAATSADGSGPVTDGFAEVTDGRTSAGPALAVAGEDLPGWSATGHSDAAGTGPARLLTGWYSLPSDFARGGLPLVVTTTGERGQGTNLVAEFGVVDGDRVTAIGAVGVPANGTEPGVTDARLDPASAPAGAQVVRLSAEDGGAVTDLPLSVSVPRVPVTAAFTDVVRPDQPAIVDWPVAFVMPCQRLSRQSEGVTDVPRWRIASVDDAGDIITAEFVGGPYAPASTLVDQVPVPVYEPGRPMARHVALYEWRPRVETIPPRRDVSPSTEPGWAAAG